MKSIPSHCLSSKSICTLTNAIYVNNKCSVLVPDFQKSMSMIGASIEGINVGDSSTVGRINAFIASQTNNLIKHNETNTVLFSGTYQG